MKIQTTTSPLTDVMSDQIALESTFVVNNTNKPAVKTRAPVTTGARPFSIARTQHQPTMTSSVTSRQAGHYREVSLIPVPTSTRSGGATGGGAGGGGVAKTTESSRPELARHKSVLRLKKSVSDLTAPSSVDNDDDDDVDDDERRNHGGETVRMLVTKRLHRRRKKQTFLTAVDSSSSTGDLSAAVAREKRSRQRHGDRSVARADSRAQTGSKGSPVLRKAPAHSTNNSLNQIDKYQEIIDRLKDDHNDVIRQNGVLQERIERLEAMGKQPTGKRTVAVDSRTAAVQVSAHTDPETRGSSSVTNGAADGEAQSLEIGVCLEILSKLLSSVKQRQSVLGKDVPPAPKGTNATRMRQTAGSDITFPVLAIREPNQVSTGSALLLGKVEELARELDLYTDQERQITHRYKVNKHGAATSGAAGALSNRSDDAVTAQLLLVEKTVTKRRHNQNGYADDLSQLVDKTRRERETCFQILCNIEKHINSLTLKM